MHLYIPLPGLSHREDDKGIFLSGPQRQKISPYLRGKHRMFGGKTSFALLQKAVCFQRLQVRPGKGQLKNSFSFAYALAFYYFCPNMH